MSNTITSISEIQNAIKNELGKNVWFTQHDVPILVENSKTIEFEIKSKMSALGITSTVATPVLSYRGVYPATETVKEGVKIPTDISFPTSEETQDVVYDCADIAMWGTEEPPATLSVRFPSLGKVVEYGFVSPGGATEWDYITSASQAVNGVPRGLTIGLDGENVYAISHYDDYNGHVHPVKLSESLVPIETKTLKQPFWEITGFNVVIVENPTLNRGRANYATALDTALQVAYSLSELPETCLNEIRQTTQGGLVVVTVSFKSNIAFMLAREDA